MALGERIAQALGPRPAPAARELLLALRRTPDASHVGLRYEWIVDWTPLLDLGFWEGQECVTFFEEKQT